MSWVKCSEKMPPVGVRVLVYRKGKKTNDGPFLAKTRNTDIRPWRYLNNERCDVTPTHWAAIPSVDDLI